MIDAPQHDVRPGNIEARSRRSTPAMLSSRLICVLFALLVVGACDKKQSKQPDRSPPVAPNEAPEEPATAFQAAAAPEYSGEPVGVAPPKVLHEARELRVERQRWRFDGTEGIAWRARVPLDSDVTLAVADDVTPFRKLWPHDDAPWVVINGGFYEQIPDSDGYRPMGLVVSNAKEISGLTRRGGSGVFYVDEGGPAVVHRKEFATAPTVALQSIDRIVADGESVVESQTGKRAARSAVVVGDSHLWFIIAAATADVSETETGARLSRSGSGMNLWAFAHYILDTTDARDALNLDGGVSTQLAVRDEDFKLYVYGVRGTINALVARPPPRAE